jgi:WD40 repeat protein
MARRKAGDKQVNVGDLTDISGEVNIASGDITRNIKIIQQRALTAGEEAARARKHEDKLLAQGIATLVQNLSVQASQGTESGNPYKGLLPYSLNETEIFHGRNRAKQDLLNHIRQNPLTVLYAESGAGKSSLLQAGIAAHLIAHGHLAVHLRPYRDDPVEFIKRMFLPELTQAPTLGEATLREFLRQVCGVLGQKVNLFLLLDQYEEFFNLLTKDERKPFLESLADCLHDSSLQVRWVLAIRAEALSNLSELESFGITQFKNTYCLNHLSRAEAREAITGPAQRYHITFEQALIDHILDTLTTNNEIAPTHLQLVCSALTDNLPEDKTLTLAYFKDHEGGTEGILRDYLKGQLEHLPAEEQAPAWKVLRALITADRRRTVKTHDEIVEELKLSGMSREQIDALLTRLVERRLLATQPAVTETFELAHDYLVKEIELDPREQARKAAQELLDQETRAYQRHRTLLTPERLAVIEPYQNELRFSADAQKLFTESQKIILSRKRRRSTVLVIISAVSILAAIAMSLLAINAQRQAKIARAGELAALALSEKDSHFSLALLLGAEAFHTAENSHTEDTLLTLDYANPQLLAYHSDHQDDVRSVAFSPDGKLLASGSSDKTIILWDVTNWTHLLKIAVLSGHRDSVSRIAFSPGSKLLASGSEGGNIILWDVSDRIDPAKLSSLSVEPYATGSVYAVRSITFSPDGKWLVAGYLNGTIVLWNVSDPAHPVQLSNFPGHPDVVHSLAFSPDGKRLASGSRDHTISLWDVSDPTHPTKLSSASKHSSYVYSVAFSPDGKRLASGSDDSDIILWDVSNPTSPVTLSIISGHHNAVRSVAFSPDGKRLASGGYDATIILWDVSVVTHPTELSTLSGHSDLVSSLAFSPDGKRLASGSYDNTIILWDVGDPTHLVRFSTEPIRADISSVAFSEGSTQLASGSLDGTITLWDVSNSTQPTKLRDISRYEGPVSSLAFSPNANLLASGSCVKFDDTVCVQGETIISDIRNPDRPIKLVTLLGGLGSSNRVAISSLAFSPDAKLLASGSQNNGIVLWDVSEPTRPTKLFEFSAKRGSGTVYSIAFSPDGQRLATGSWDKTIILWDVSDPTHPTELSTLFGHSDRVSSLAFSPDGKRLAAGSWDKTVILWDVSNPTRPVRLFILSGYDDAVIGVVFRPDGKRLVSTSGDGSIMLWNLDPQSWIRSSCQRAGRNFTRAEWAQYIPYKPYPTKQEDATCPQWPLEPEAMATPPAMP